MEAARTLLENPGFTMRLANMLGAPIEKGFALLPQGWNENGEQSRPRRADESPQAGRGEPRQARPPPWLPRVFPQSPRRHLRRHWRRFPASRALPVELPASTAIMLRSIADIARSEGHDISELKTRLDCLEVFAFGSRQASDDATDSAYWLTRAALGKTISEAASHLTGRGAVDVASPAIVRLVNSIASRFGVLVSEELAAKALPIVGAAGGSIVNVLFIAHFQDMARGHFIVKRLETRHGIETVREVYERMALPAPPKLLKGAKG